MSVSNVPVAMASPVLLTVGYRLLRRGVPQRTAARPSWSPSALVL